MKTLLAYPTIFLGLSALINCSGYDSGPAPSPASSTSTSAPSGTPQGSPAEGGAAAPVAAATVVVGNFKFDPPSVTIKAGQTVHFAFQSGKHNVVSGKNCTADSQFSSGATVSAP